MNKIPCQPETVFVSASCDIQLCPDCQLIHLTMGAITIRMAEQHFLELAQDLGQGAFELQSQRYPNSLVKAMM